MQPPSGPVAGAVPEAASDQGRAPALETAPADAIAPAETKPASGSTPTVQNRQRAVQPAPSAQLGDVIPQVAQVRQYVAQRWQGAADIHQTLQYTLVLNADGSLQQVIPRGQAAKLHRDRIPLPDLNQPFVLPLAAPGTPKIRLVLDPKASPNTRVRTLLESE